MSKLINVLEGVYDAGAKMMEDGGGSDAEILEAKEHIKDLIRDLIDETFDKDDAKAYELWQKVEKL